MRTILGSSHSPVINSTTRAIINSYFGISRAVHYASYNKSACKGVTTSRPVFYRYLNENADKVKSALSSASSFTVRSHYTTRLTDGYDLHHRTRLFGFSSLVLGRPSVSLSDGVREGSTMAPVGVNSEAIAAKLEAFVKENNVMIFSKTFCPFCNKVSPT